MSAGDELAARLRSLVVFDPRVSEKKMFGGVCFLLDGKILVAARRTGTLLVQCGAVNAAEALREPGVSSLVMAGKPAANFIDVDDESLESDEALGRWIAMAERYLGTLPPAKPSRRAGKR